MSENLSPHVILGTMNFGGQVDEKTADQMVRIFVDQGYRELDTAHRYCEGRTEEILGRILAPSLREKIYLATKVTPQNEEGLRPEQVIKQLEISLRRLRTDYVDLLYLHAPDLKTPITKTLEACERLFKQGKLREFGLSNYAAWQVVDIWHICNQKGWRAPGVYQGMYNAITRDVERELFPALRTVGIKFYAYNPLAGGFLTGKYLNVLNKPSEGRFALNRVYLDRYWKATHFGAVDLIRRTCEAEGSTMADCALRWMKHHSFLRGVHGDGYIIAATSLDQFKNNLESCSGKELPAGLIRIFDDAWEIVRPDCPHYFRT
ncbi:MAG TPA: aldo/keto reductase [Thermodesulfobacteriota bacterium]|nr:aldo/keto reductase [Thermodesulfobacteriota bacterium]